MIIILVSESMNLRLNFIIERIHVDDLLIDIISIALTIFLSIVFLSLDFFFLVVSRSLSFNFFSLDFLFYF